MEGDFANQGLSSELVGLLILNELKCFRKELTNEVKNLARKLDRITAHDSYCQNRQPAAGKKINSSRLPWQGSSVFQAPTTSNSSSFKEISPDSDNSILNNHIAFRMSNAFSDIEPQNQVRANVYPGVCHINNDMDVLEDQQLNSITENKDLKVSSAYHEPPSKEPQVLNTFQDSIAIDDENPNCLNFEKTQSWSSTTNDKSSNSQVATFKFQAPKKKPMEKQELLSKCAIIYKCNACDEQFDMESLYKMHYSEVHESNATSQDLTSSSFWKDQSIKNVFDQPQPRIIYLCKICSRDFSSRGSLIRHSMLHSGVKKFVCKICGKRFFRSDHLKSHLPTHSRQKQFQCNICCKYFSRAAIFEQHMKMHQVIQLPPSDSDLDSGRFDGSTEASSLPKVNEEGFVMKTEQADDI